MHSWELLLCGAVPGAQTLLWGGRLLVYEKCLTLKLLVLMWGSDCDPAVQTAGVWHIVQPYFTCTCFTLKPLGVSVLRALSSPSSMGSSPVLEHGWQLPAHRWLLAGQPLCTSAVEKHHGFASFPKVCAEPHCSPLCTVVGHR